MAVSVLVMPLATWLSGRFRLGWEGDALPGRAPLRRKSVDLARTELEGWEAEIERLLGIRPHWREEGPARLATLWSADGFARPFLQARRWSYRLCLPLLCALELPQLWIPEAFGVIVRLAAPWNREIRFELASTASLEDELGRLLDSLRQEPAMEELQGLGEGGTLSELGRDYYRTMEDTRRLREIARLSLAERLPVIVEDGAEVSGRGSD